MPKYDTGRVSCSGRQARTMTIGGGIMFKKAVAFILVLVLLVPFGSALAIRYYRVSTSWLKAYRKPDHSSAVADSYRRDFAVTIAKKYGGGWAKVRFHPGGAAVFVQTKYLKPCSSYTAYVNRDSTVLYSGPAVSFRSRGKLDKGAKVTVLTHGSAFDYVSSSKGKGYIRNSRLSTRKPSVTTAYIKNYENKRVCLRKGPGMKYKTIADYPTGTRVSVLKYGRTWCKVSVNGKTGYIRTVFIQYR